MAKCDLCGERCKVIELVQLLGPYQAAGVVDLCQSCEKWANKIKGDMLDEIAPRMRKAIVERMGLLPAAPTKIWWRRFMAGLEA